MFQLPLVVLIQLVALFAAGIYSFIWRYIGMAEIRSFVHAAFYSLAPIVLMRFALPDVLQSWRVPLSVSLMDTVLAFGGVLGLRVVRRALYERFEQPLGKARAGQGGRHRRVLLAGAGQAGVMAVRELSRNPGRDVELVGFVDDDPQKLGSVIHGVKVLGDSHSLESIVPEHRVEEVVVTMVRASRPTLRRLVAECQRIGVACRIVPGLFEILEGRVNVSRFREVQIEDLLGREPVQLEEDEMRAFLAGRRVLISGAGGSIGAEIARQVVRFGPRCLVLVERAEPALFVVEQELRALWPDLELEALVADVGEETRMRAILSACRARGGDSRGGPQARALDGGESGGGAAQQRARRLIALGAGVARLGSGPSC